MKNLHRLIYVCLILLLVISCSDDETVSKSETNAKNFYSMKDGLITLQSGVVVEKKGDLFYFQGDMVLSKDQLEALDKYGDFIIKGFNQYDSKDFVHPAYNIVLESTDNTTPIPRAFGLNPTPYNMWAMVRFVYSSDLTYDRKRIIQEALHHWEANTNVRFYNATGQPTEDPQFGFKYPYIEFVNSTVNNSYVGRIGGRQVINLAAGQPTSVAIHEIGHAIGLRHEQTRYDRDDFINLNLANVPPENRHNFDKYTTNFYAVGSIDYNSIMMYGSFDFAINPSIPVMTRKSDGSTWLGGNILSNYDKSWANSLYLPYVARSDVYRELSPVVYKKDNTAMTPEERLSLQSQLNNGDPTPPDCCLLPNSF